MANCGYLIWADHAPMVAAASLAVAIVMVRQSYPAARIVGGTDWIGTKIVDDCGTIAYYLSSEDLKRLKECKVL